MNDGKFSDKEEYELLGIGSAEKSSLQKREESSDMDPFSDSEYEEIEEELFALADAHDTYELSEEGIESLLKGSSFLED